MSELSIRRDIELSSARYQKAVKTEKQAAAGKTGAVESVRARSNLSESLQKLVSKLNQMTTGLSRADRRLIQAGESSLTEVKGSLDRMGKLAEEAAQGGGGDRAALQGELEKLSREVDRLLQSASYNGVKLFGTEGEEAYTELATDMMELMRELVDRAAAGEIPEQSDMRSLMDGIRQLMDKMAGGATPDQALQELADGQVSSLLDFIDKLGDQDALELLSEAFPGLDLSALASELGAQSAGGGLEGYDLDLLLGLASARQSAGAEEKSAQASLPQAGAEAPAAQQARSADGTAPQAQPAVRGQQPQAPLLTRQLGDMEITGRDLSGVSYDPKTGVLTLSGSGDVTVRGQGKGLPEGQSIVLKGSGTVTLKDAKAAVVTVESAEGKLAAEGENTVSQVRLRPGAALRLEGGGHLRLGAVEGDQSNTLIVSGGAVTVDGGEGDLDAIGSVLVEGGASLMAHASHVRGAGGETKAPLDLMLKTFLPGWDGVTELEVDGRAARTALSAHTDQVRLWLGKDADPTTHGYPAHTVVLRGRGEDDERVTHYAFIQWNERTGRFREINMYPNPFTVTGGVEGTDWSYDEPTQTLRLLTDQVNAVSGGAGSDAEDAAFHGRVCVENNVGPMTLILDGVNCAALAGRALDLGRGNEITLLLEHDTENRFLSGPGCAGISLGDGTTLIIDVTVTGDAEAEPEPEEPPYIDLTSPPASQEGTDGEEGGEEPPPPNAWLIAEGGEGGAGIGRDGAGSWDRVSRITIRGGTITAVGKGAGAGIGAGKYGFMGDIEITGGTVSATGGKLGGAGIGGALGAPVGNITISGGEITATALYHAAAIGAGVEGECGDVHIGASARIVKAKGGDPGADIGACAFGKSGHVTVEDGADTGVAVPREEAGGIPLGTGDDALTLPRLQLSAKTLLLNTLNVSDWDSAWAAKGVINAAMRRITRLREAYGDLYGQSDEFGPSPRSMEEAEELFRSLRSGPEEGLQQPHGEPGSEEVNRLLK